MGENAQAERERQDQEIAEDNRQRQIRQGHVSSGSEEEEGKPAKPKAEPKQKSE